MHHQKAPVLFVALTTQNDYRCPKREVVCEMHDRFMLSLGSRDSLEPASSLTFPSLRPNFGFLNPPELQQFSSLRASLPGRKVRRTLNLQLF